MQKLMRPWQTYLVIACLFALANVFFCVPNRRARIVDGERMANSSTTNGEVDGLGDDQHSTLSRASGREEVPREVSVSYAQSIQSQGPRILNIVVLSKPSKEPIPAARVFARDDIVSRNAVRHGKDSHGDLLTAPLTDPLGCADLSLPSAGDIVIKVVHAQYADKTMLWSGGSGETLCVELESKSEVYFYGKALTAECQVPALGATACLVSDRRQYASKGDGPLHKISEPTVVATAEVDSRGLFQFSFVPEGFLSVRLFGNAYGTAEVAIDSFGNEPSNPLVFCLVAGGTIRYQAPPGLSLSAIACSQGGSAMQWTPRHEQEGGACTISDLPIDRELLVTIGSGKSNYFVLEEPLFPGEERSRMFEEDWGCVVSGVLSDQLSAPVTGVEVSVFTVGPDGGPGMAGPVTLTDSSGVFTVGRLSPGRWQLSFRGKSPGRLDVAFEQMTIEIYGEKELYLRPRAHRGLFISGQTRKKDGAAVVNAHVYAESESTGVRVDGRSSKEGLFEVGPLLPGSYRTWVLGSDEHVKVEAGATGVVLVGRETTPIRGRVMQDEEGIRAEVFVAPKGDRGSILIEADNDGCFLVPESLVGTYCLTARTRSGLTGKILIEADGVNQGLAIIGCAEGGSLELESSLGESCAYRIYSEGWLIAQAVLTPGTRVICPVPTGTFDVVYDVKGESIRRSGRALKGEVAGIVLR